MIDENINEWSMLTESFCKTLESATDYDRKLSSFHRHIEGVVETLCLHKI